MSDTWLLYLASFAVAFSISLLTTPMAKRLGIKFHAVDYPRARGMNKHIFYRTCATYGWSACNF